MNDSFSKNSKYAYLYEGMNKFRFGDLSSVKLKNNVEILKSRTSFSDRIATICNKESVQLAWVKVFRINPAFRIFRLTFHP